MHNPEDSSGWIYKIQIAKAIMVWMHSLKTAFYLSYFGKDATWNKNIFLNRRNATNSEMAPNTT